MYQFFLCECRSSGDTLRTSCDEIEVNSSTSMSNLTPTKSTSSDKVNIGYGKFNIQNIYSKFMLSKRLFLQ